MFEVKLITKCKPVQVYDCGVEDHYHLTESGAEYCIAYQQPSKAFLDRKNGIPQRDFDIFCRFIETGNQSELMVRYDLSSTTVGRVITKIGRQLRYLSTFEHILVEGSFTPTWIYRNKELIIPRLNRYAEGRNLKTRGELCLK